MFILLSFVLGLIVGSFLNVCIYRLPLNQSLIRPRSYCTVCKQQLPLRDILPVISFLLLHGRCRFCDTLVSRRYICVELLTGLLFVWCFFIFDVSFLSIKAWIVTSFLLCITFIDLDHQLILDKVLLWFALCGIIMKFFSNAISFWDMVIAALVGGGVLLLVAILTHGGMGGGDIKFVAALGLWLGLKLTLLTVLLSFLIGGLAGALLLAAHIKKRKDFIPFGPFIAVSAFICLLYGEQIISWYLASSL